MNLLDAVRSCFNDQVRGLLGAVTGENESKLHDGVDAAMFQVLKSMTTHARTESGRGVLWRELREADPELSERVEKELYFRNSEALAARGNEQLAGLLGSKSEQIVASVSRAADISGTSARRIVGTVAPVVLSKAAAWRNAYNVNEFDTAKWLIDQEAEVDREMGQRFAPGVMGLSTATGAVDSAVSDESVNQFFSGEADAPTSHRATVVADSDGVPSDNSGDGVSTAAGFAASQVAQVGGDDTAASEGGGDGVVSADSVKDEHAGRWVPDSAALHREREERRAKKERLAQGAPHDGDIADSSKEAGGCFHWLWWPVLLLGGLLALGVGFKKEIKDYLQERHIALPAVSPLQGTDTPAAKAGDSAEPESAEPELDGAESDAGDETDDSAKDLANRADDPSSESTSVGSSNESANQPAAAKDIEGSADSSAGKESLPDESADASTESEAMPADGAAESPDAGDAEDGDGENAADKEVVEPNAGELDEEAAPSDGEENAGDDEEEGQDEVDFQIESILTAIEVGLKNVDDAPDLAKLTKRLSGRVEALKDVLDRRENWIEEDRVLVDLQLQDFSKNVAKLKQNALNNSEARKLLSKPLKRLERLLKTPPATSDAN